MRLAAVLLALCLEPALACDVRPDVPQATEARATGGDIRHAFYSDPTERYDHGVLGDAVEAGALRVDGPGLSPCTHAVVLPAQSVFEDTGPRIADLDGDGRNEVIVVETRTDRGAALAVYGLRDGRLRRLDATPPIGRRHRWLAPAAVADLDGDGRIEIAYVDRPHLARRLTVWEWRDGRLHPEAAMDGVTNHRIGDTGISGGLRDCGGAPEIVLLTPDWSTLVAVAWTGTEFRQRRIGPHRGAGSLAAALACR